MRRLLERLLHAASPSRQRWAEVPDHESTSVLCRLAWHAWDVTTVHAVDLDDVDGGAPRLVVVGRERVCRACGRVEGEVRSW